MLKKRLWILILPVILMFGCVGQETDMRPQFSHLKIAQYHEDDRYGYDEDFLEQLERARTGDEPASVCVSGETIDETLREKDVVSDLWRTVTGYYVSTDTQTPSGDAGQILTFSFTWKDGTEYAFRFLPVEDQYYYLYPGEICHRVSEPDNTVAATLELIAAYLEQPEGQREWITLEEKIESQKPPVVREFDWDADGDGTAEHFVTHLHEGRRLNDDLNIVMTDGENELADVWLESQGYIRNLQEGEDKQGPYLLFDHTYAYYMEEYIMEEEVRMVLRYIDKELVLEVAPAELQG
ncbi:MAG: hypothetical protein IJJ34_06805 [Clostridia bacterium]|nr:hypothetical protein [Clostridia bacterium]